MSSTRRSFFLLALIAIAATGPAHAAPSWIDKAGRFLTMGELRAMYSGKTWFWNDGGGYFRRDGRFQAMSGSGKEISRVMGGWGAYRSGKVCFSGTWQARLGDGFDSTCFQHRKIGRTIYQKRSPWGEWIVFRRAPASKNDEYRKVVRGNYTNWYVKRQRVAQSATQRKSRRTARQR